MKKFFLASMLLSFVSVPFLHAQSPGPLGIHQTLSGKLWLVNRADFISVENLVGLELLSPAGKLLPGPAGQNGPFQFALSNTKHNITFANLVGSIGLSPKSQTELPMGYDGNAASGDLRAAANPFVGSFVPITSDIPEPTTGWLVAFGLLGALGFRPLRG